MNNAYKSIARGLKQAIDLEKGKAVKARLHSPENLDVASLRKQLKLTQGQFAAKFCVSLGTLRHWERGDRRPHGPALALLHVVRKEPKAVLRALA